MQKERLHKMTDTQTQALAKIDEGAKAAGFGRVADAMKDFVATALRDFIRQDAEFAQAVVQGGSFAECMAAEEPADKPAGLLLDLSAFL